MSEGLRCDTMLSLRMRIRVYYGIYASVFDFSYSMKICDGNIFTRVAPEQLYDVVLTCRLFTD